MSRPGITLAMIVRDEEVLLARCLDSAAPLVDEMVVVDTGSSDGTVRVASSRGARVAHLDWAGDFAAARNRSLEEAALEWILVLDADEVLEEYDSAALERQLQDPFLLALEIVLINEYGKGETRRFRATRLFRNHPDIRYRFPVHELVTPSIEQRVRGGEGTTGVSSIVVRHHGYTPERIEEKDKARRNRSILQAYLDAGGNDLYVEYQAARQELGLVGEQILPRRELPACMERLQRVRRRMDDPLPSFAPEVYLRLAQGHIALEQDDDALTMVEEGIRNTGDRIYFRFFDGLLRSDAAALRACVDRPSPTDSFETDLQYAGAYPLAALGRLAFRDGAAQEALARLRQAVQRAPWYAAPHVILGQNELERGAPQRALEHFLKAIKTCPDDPQGWMGAARAALELELKEQARQWIARIVEKLPLCGPAVSLGRDLGIEPGP